MVMECAKEELEPKPEGKSVRGSAAKKKTRHEIRPVPADTAAQRRGTAHAVIDCHGMTRQDAIRAVDHAIDRGILNGVEKVQIIHGIGTGKVMDALQRHLATLRVVKRFALDDRNPGVTWVYL
jgi:DNA mismatch repair protein MutS2